MFYKEHEPAHFHAEHQGQQAKFDFGGNVVAGQIQSGTAVRLIREWAALHRAELEANWANMKAGRVEAKPIVKSPRLSANVGCPDPRSVMTQFVSLHAPMPRRSRRSPKRPSVTRRRRQHRPRHGHVHCRESYGAAIQADQIASPNPITLVCEEGGQFIGFAQLRWRHASPAVRRDRAGRDSTIVRRSRVARAARIAQRFMQSALTHSPIEAADVGVARRWERNPRAMRSTRSWGLSPSASTPSSRAGSATRCPHGTTRGARGHLTSVAAVTGRRCAQLIYGSLCSTTRRQPV